MLKYLLLVCVCVIAYLFIKASARKGGHSDSDRDTSLPHVQSMAKCSYCGVHFPKDEGLQSQGRIYCSIEHKRANQ